MKKNITILICLVLTSNLALCQQGIIFNFDQDTNYKKYFYIDSTDVNNTWQVGKPQKSIFSTAQSPPNALVTDTVNHYPVNDTSTITLIKKVIYHNPEPIVVLDFYYYVNTDTISDYWKLEASADKGLTWLNPDITTWIWWEIAPIFSGNTMGWQYAIFKIFTYEFPTDTLLFRFTFISDSIESFKDGLMIDNIAYDEYISSIDENNIQSAFTVFYKGNEEIELVQQGHLIENGKTCIEFFDLPGRTQYCFELKDTPVNNFKMPGIKDGIYLYAIKNKHRLIQSGKILIK